MTRLPDTDSADELHPIPLTTSPPLGLKLFFWLILGCLSVVFAEVLSGADPFPFFTLWGIVVILPLYTLHLLVFVHIAFTCGRSKPSFTTLYLAGTLIGMYEAYITKVLWNPPWSGAVITFGGVAVLTTLMLVLFFHPVFAFIVPLLAGESLMPESSSIRVPLPAWIRKRINGNSSWRWIVALLALFLGSMHAANSTLVVNSLLSGLSAIAILTTLIALWRRTAGSSYTITQLLPDRREFFILAAILAIFYLVTSMVINPEELPDLKSQATIWAIYAILIALFIASLKRSQRLEADNLTPLPKSSGAPALLLFGIVCTVSSAIFKWIAPAVSQASMVAFWAIGIAIGLYLFGRSAWSVIFNRSDLDRTWRKK